MALQWRDCPDGSLECVDTDTGLVVERQRPSKGRVSKTGKRIGRGVAHKYQKVRDSNDQVVTVPAGTNPDHLPVRLKTWVECNTTKDNILKHLWDGDTISEIGKMEGFPSENVIWKWAVKDEAFAKQIDLARGMKGHVAFDRIVALARDVETKTEKEIPAMRLAFDMLKHIAQTMRPETYSPKPVAAVAGAITVVINTGINRELKEVESE